MSNFAAFLRDCTHADLLALPVEMMSTEQIELTILEIRRRNDEGLRRVKEQIKEREA